MTSPVRSLFNVFLTGLVAALPLAATLLIFVWGARLLYEYLGPGSLLGRLLSSIGLGVTGSEVAGYGIGVLIVLAAIFVLGLVVQTRLRHGLGALVNGLVQRVPVVRSVYDMIRRFVEMMSQRDASGLGAMSPVWLHFGGPGNAAVLALLSASEPVEIDGRAYLAVLVPTAPVPVGGALLYVPTDWVTPAAVGAEGLTSIYVSMGVTSAQHLARAPVTATGKAAPVASGPA